MTGYSDRETARQSPVLRLGGVENCAPLPRRRRWPRSSALRGMSRGTEPGYLGISHRPFSPSGQGMSNPAPGERRERPTGLEERKDLLATFDDVRRDIDASGTMAGLDSFTTRAFDMVVSGTVRSALDLNKEEEGDARALQGRRAVPDGPSADRGGCRLRDDGHRRLGHHGNNFMTLKKTAAPGGPRHRQPDPGPARPRPGQGRGDRHVGRIRPHTEGQQERRPRTTGRRSCRP